MTVTAAVVPRRSSETVWWTTSEIGVHARHTLPSASLHEIARALSAEIEWHQAVPYP